MTLTLKPIELSTSFPGPVRDWWRRGTKGPGNEVVELLHTGEPVRKEASDSCYTQGNLSEKRLLIAATLPTWESRIEFSVVHTTELTTFWQGTESSMAEHVEKNTEGHLRQAYHVIQEQRGEMDLQRERLKQQEQSIWQLTESVSRLKAFCEEMSQENGHKDKILSRMSDQLREQRKHQSKLEKVCEGIFQCRPNAIRVGGAGAGQRVGWGGDRLLFTRPHSTFVSVLPFFFLGGGGGGVFLPHLSRWTLEFLEFQDGACLNPGNKVNWRQLINGKWDITKLIAFWEEAPTDSAEQLKYRSSEVQWPLPSNWSTMKYNEVQKFRSTMAHYRAIESTMKYNEVQWSTMKYRSSEVQWPITAGQETSS